MIPIAVLFRACYCLLLLLLPFKDVARKTKIAPFPVKQKQVPTQKSARLGTTKQTKQSVDLTLLPRLGWVWRRRRRSRWRRRRKKPLLLLLHLEERRSFKRRQFKSSWWKTLPLLPLAPSLGWMTHPLAPTVMK